MKNEKKINRRHFLKASVSAGGGLLISFALPVSAARFLTDPSSAESVTMNTFLRIDPDNSTHVILSKVEMGQGIWTTLPMLIAEELDCDWNTIRVAHRALGKGDDFKTENIFTLSTGGSDSTRSEFDRFRMAGATARTLLVAAAAKKMSVQPEMCRTEKGFVIAGDRRLSYGEVAWEASQLPVPEVKLRDPSSWKYIGKSQIRLDNGEKINGKAKYGLDIQFPGLLTALVARSPVMGGKVKTFDATNAKAIPGVRDVVQIPTGIAVVADHFWAAKQGRDALVIEWDRDTDASLDTVKLLSDYRAASRTNGTVSQQKGDVANALKESVKTVDLEFVLPYLAHAPMEPVNCTVKIEADRCIIWTGTQSALLHQAEAAEFLGLKPDQVEFNVPYLGGSFGRRGTFDSDWVIEAVRIAKATGKAVKLVWTREEDITGGYYRPLYLHRVSIGIDQHGFPIAWHHRIVGQSLFVNTPLEEFIVKNGIDYSSVGGVHGSPYLESVPDHKVELHTTTVNIAVLAWRAVGNTHTAFVMETLIDELAAMSSKDPVEYRRAMLKNHPRHLAALNLAVEKSGWNEPLPGDRYRGVAIHAAMGSYVCDVIEISVKDKDIRVHRVVCAIDCGLAVNPDGVRAQMEGSIIYALTAALYGEITLENGKVKQRNFDGYRMMRIKEAPVIEVHIVTGDNPMGGAGEPGVPPVAPALTNALFAATGKRIRRLPVRIEEIGDRS